MRRIALVLVVVLAAVAAGWWLRSPVEVVPHATSVTSSSTPPRSLPQATKPRVVLPRPPARTLPTRTEGVVAPPARPSLVDRRPPEEQDGGETMARLRPKLDAIDASISACIGAWMELDPTLSAKVMLGFSLGPEGLQEAWVEDHGSVPDGPLSCFAAAVYEEDWSGVVSSPGEITMEFAFDGAEAP